MIKIAVIAALILVLIGGVIFFGLSSIQKSIKTSDQQNKELAGDVNKSCNKKDYGGCNDDKVFMKWTDDGKRK